MAELIYETRDCLLQGRAGKTRSLKRSSPESAALDYYDGNLYRVRGFRRRLASAVLEGNIRALILSGAYGVVFPNEFIHDYEEYFNPDYWLRCGLSEVIIELVSALGVQRVYAFVTLAYAKVLRSISWQSVKVSIDEAGLLIIGNQGIGTPSKLAQAMHLFLDLGSDREALLEKMPLVRWEPFLPSGSK